MLPPQTVFTSAPYSIYRKGSAKRSSRRYTYAFVAQSTLSDKPQLICFAEETRKDATRHTVKTTYSPSGSARSIIAIDSIPVSPGGSEREGCHDVLAVFDNGDAICLSSDLEVVRWVANFRSLAQDLKNSFEIEHVTLSTARAVIHGFLRSREDVVAILNSSSDDKSDLLDLTQVLSVIFRQPNGDRALGLFQISPRSPDLPTSHIPPLKYLMAWDLPSSPSVPIIHSARPQYSLHSNSGALHLLADNALISYDFSSAVPKVYSQIDMRASRPDSFLRISQGLLLTTSRKSCRLLDVKYSSIQGHLSLEADLDSSTQESKKRKHAKPEPVEDAYMAPVFISYHADLGLAVAIWKNEVVGLQVRETTARKRVKTDNTRLIDSLGKGIATGPSAVSTGKREQRKWQEKVSKFDKCVRKGKIATFEALFAADLGIESDTSAEEDESIRLSTLFNGPPDAVMTNGVSKGTPNSQAVEGQKASEDSSEDRLRKWRLPKSIPGAQQLSYQQHARYALSRIFRWTDSRSSRAGSRGSLTIDFFPPNVFQWLLQSGYLTKESICRAVSDNSLKILETPADLKDGDIVRAVAEFDPELHILSAILNHSHFLPVGEVVQAIKLIMQSLDDGPKTEATTRLLTNGIEESTDSMDVDIASELEAADHEINRALSILDNGLVVRSSTLRPALIRLHTFPGPVISSTLRSTLPRRDLESLVRLLHHEFKNGGWTSPYDFADSEVSPVEPPSEETNESAVTIIASLLSCTLDAIGPAMWLTAVGGSASDTSTEELIVNLLEDTSVALNGFWEATYIRGLISELLRYASKLPQSQKPSKKTLQNQGKPFVLDTKPDELPMLPLGAKADLGIEKMKAGKGGKSRERSAREIGMLISQRVPKYSFERIIL